MPIFPALAAGALLAVTAGAEAGPRPDALAAEVLALAARGDLPSLARAAALVPDALRADPAFHAAAANRTLAELLAAASLREISAASPGGGEGLRLARAMRESALEELRPLASAWPGDPAVLRALAVYQGLGGRGAELEPIARRARDGGRDDPWIDFAETAAAARGKGPAEAAPLLAAFVATHPAILPPRLSLARAQLALGGREEALATLDALLAADPDHEDAKALKAELLAPPPVAMPAPAVPTGAPPRSAPGHLPRKPAPGRPPPQSG